MTMAELYAQFGLDVNTIDFVGHALALHQSDGYMAQPALGTVAKIKLYYDSMMRCGGAANGLRGWCGGMRWGCSGVGGVEDEEAVVVWATYPAH